MVDFTRSIAGPAAPPPVKAAFGHSPAYAPSIVVLPFFAKKISGWSDYMRACARARDDDVAHL